jgi:FkbM family methyltransferase
MKLSEAAHINRLPLQLRNLLWRYTFKKPLGLGYTNEEKEANIALRVLSKSDSSIEKIDATGMTWQVKSFGQSFAIETRRHPSSDMGIMFQIFCKEEYRPAVDLLMKGPHPGRPLNILDAGANVGLSSLYFRSAFPDCNIACLEIDDSNFTQLTKNLGSQARVSLHKKALWKTDAWLDIGIDFRDKSECSYYVIEAEQPTTLRGHPISHFVNEAGWDWVDLLKIDIEGSERFLFETPELAKEILSRTNLLAIEIHDEFNFRPSIYKYLQQEGFRYFEHGDLTIAHRVP